MEKETGNIFRKDEYDIEFDKMSEDEQENILNEAKRINEDIDEMCKNPELIQKTKNELAQIALNERAEMVSLFIKKNKKLANEIQLHYKRNNVNGLNIFVEPRIEDQHPENLLRDQKYKKFISEKQINNYLPKSFIKIGEDQDSPDIFIHSKEKIIEIEKEASTAGFMLQSDTNYKNISLVYKKKKSLDNIINKIIIEDSYELELFKTFVHEFVHNQEPFGEYWWGESRNIFAEGIARKIELKVVKQDPHNSFIEIFFIGRKLLKSKHPLDNSYDDKYAKFNFDLEKLLKFSFRFSGDEKDEHYGLTESIRRYSFTSSFVDWYEKTHENDVFELLKKGAEIYSNYESVAEDWMLINNDKRIEKPLAYLVLAQYNKEFFPYLKKLGSIIEKHPKEEMGSLYAEEEFKEVMERFALAIREYLKKMSADYNKFMDKKISIFIEPLKVLKRARAYLDSKVSKKEEGQIN